METQRILLIKYSKTTLDCGEEAVTCDSYLQEGTDIKRKLFVKGCVDFEMYNTGSESVFLWGAVEILPGQSFVPRKSTNLPFANDIQFNWATDYEITRIAPVNAAL